MMAKIDDKILAILGDGESRSEWYLAQRIYPWENDRQRSRHGAWIRVIVQSLWRMWNRGTVNYFWQKHGEGIQSTRIWFKCSDKGVS